MGPGFGAGMDLGGLVWAAVFGMCCAGLLILGAIGFVIWFVINHVQIV
jgi:hypothetical protein